MLIDWFTVSAQIVNFLVLVFLLKHFLYKPITTAMEKRQKEIASRLEETRKQNEGARKEAALYRSKINEIAVEREEILRKATEEAQARKDELLKAAADEVDHKKAAWEQALNEEKSAFLAELRTRTSEETFAVARRALQDLANVTLEEELIAGFKKHLKGMSEKEKNDLRNLLLKEKSITVRSAFEIKDKKDLADFLKKELTADNTQVNYEVSPGLIAGIEIKGNGYKASWSLKDYLNKMEENISEFIDTGIKK